MFLTFLQNQITSAAYTTLIFTISLPSYTNQTHTAIQFKLIHSPLSISFSFSITHFPKFSISPFPLSFHFSSFSRENQTENYITIFLLFCFFRWRSESNMSSAVDAAGNPIPTSAVLMASSKHIGLRCHSENLEFLKCKKKDQNPEKCLDKGRDVTRCVLGLWVSHNLFIYFLIKMLFLFNFVLFDDFFYVINDSWIWMCLFGWIKWRWLE